MAFEAAFAIGQGNDLHPPREVAGARTGCPLPTLS